MAAMVALSIVLLSTEVPNGECFSSANAIASVVRSNATRIADGLPDDEEFWMESETSRRILQQAGNKPRTLNVLDQTKTHCNANVYSSCDPTLNKNYQQRNCGYQNTCGRPGN